MPLQLYLYIYVRNVSWPFFSGTAYGRGAYFARDFSYSFNFSGADSSGHMKMYMCRVLTGDFTVGSSSMMVAPPKGGSETYDSVVDNTSNPAIYSDIQRYARLPRVPIVIYLNSLVHTRLGDCIKHLQVHSLC